MQVVGGRPTFNNPNFAMSTICMAEKQRLSLQAGFPQPNVKHPLQLRITNLAKQEVMPELLCSKAQDVMRYENFRRLSWHLLDEKERIT